MSFITIKSYIINLFIDIKAKIHLMLNNDKTFSNNQVKYSYFLTELSNVLTTTLLNIENIYYKYFLLPKLQKL